MRVCLKQHDDGQNGPLHYNRQLVFFFLTSFFSFSFVYGFPSFLQSRERLSPVSAHACLVQQQEKGAFRIQETDGNILSIPDCLFRMIGRRQFDGLFFSLTDHPIAEKTHANSRYTD